VSRFLSVDAGGSTLRAALFEEDGRLADHFLQRLNANITSAGFNGVFEGFEKIRERTGEVCEIIVSMAGVGGKTENDQICKIISGVFKNIRYIEVITDGEGSLRANFPKKSGILAICGTGSIVYGKNENEKLFRGGGWGYLLGDEASAFWLVKELFKMFILFSDGLGEDRSYFDIFRKNLSEHPRDALHFFYTGSERTFTASLAKQFLETEQFPETEDNEITEILREGIKNFLKSVLSVCQRINFPNPEIAVMGGMFSSSLFESIFREELELVFENFSIKKGIENIEIELGKQLVFRRR